MDEVDAREIYFGFYVNRRDTSKNRIKEAKNMGFSDDYHIIIFRQILCV